VQDLKKICDESLVSLESFTPSNPEPINVVLEKQIQVESEGKPLDRNRMKQTLDKLKGQALPIDLYRVPIEVRVTGNFTDLLQLFRQLEKYGRVISIEDISISKIQAKGATGDRLSKAKQKKEKEDTGSLYSTFDLVAYTAAKEQETLPFAELKKTVSGTGKFAIKSKRKRG
jgi:Tfp pilus assembly protein PilO